MKDQNTEDTRQRILRVASALFANQGFEATTLRAITEAANANLAAVNYYFRSKEDLAITVLESAILPIVASRTAALDACLKDTSNPISMIERISRALVEPLVKLSTGEDRNSLLLLMRVRPDMNDPHARLVAKHFKPLHEKFVTALETILPHLSRAEIALRYDGARGATLQTLVELAPARKLVVKPKLQNMDTVKGLVRFVSSAFQAAAAF